jgi:hypothetical protein
MIKQQLSLHLECANRDRVARAAVLSQRDIEILDSTSLFFMSGRGNLRIRLRTSAPLLSVSVLCVRCFLLLCLTALMLHDTIVKFNNKFRQVSYRS